MEAKRKRKRWPLVLVGILLTLLLGAALVVTWYFNLLPQRWYKASHFGIETLQSETDYNKNGVDDYRDIMLGARADAKNHPTYDPAYWDGGYPPDDIGVCTDVVWRAFAHAGYSLKDLVDADIAANPELYPRLDPTGVDPNIDFRRVDNLVVFFSRHSTSLTTEVTDIAQWQPGDIVIFGDNYSHIGIVSDKRNADGVPWLIHNGGQPKREEDVLAKYELIHGISGHFRWDYVM